MFAKSNQRYKALYPTRKQRRKLEKRWKREQQKLKDTLARAIVGGAVVAWVLWVVEGR